jgi:membrane protein DedA with SNARE-associated domain
MRRSARAGCASACFLVLDLLGTLLGTGLLAGAGYAFGRSAVDVAEAISRYGLWIALAITVAIVVRMRLRQR